MKLSSFVILLYQTFIYTCLAFSPNLPLRNLSSNHISRYNTWFDVSKLSQSLIRQSSRFGTTELQSATKTTEGKKQSPSVVSGTASKVNTSSTNTILADRICIDFVQTLSPTEGCWIGSSTRVMALVLSEATETSFIPFRINAGPIHSCVLLKDGLTSKCLSELEAGDEILMTDCLDGTSRSIAVGRVTVDAKPCNVINLRGCNSEDNTEESAQIFIEDSESVRLGQVTGNFVRSTEIPGMEKEESSCEVLLRLSKVENHVVNGYRNISFSPKESKIEETDEKEEELEEKPIKSDQFVKSVEMKKPHKYSLYQRVTDQENSSQNNGVNRPANIHNRESLTNPTRDVGVNEYDEPVPDRVLELWSTIYDSLKAQRPILRSGATTPGLPRTPQESYDMLQSNTTPTGAYNSRPNSVNINAPRQPPHQPARPPPQETNNLRRTHAPAYVNGANQQSEIIFNMH